MVHMFTIDNVALMSCGQVVLQAQMFLQQSGKTVTTPHLDAKWLLDGVFYLQKCGIKQPTPDYIPVDDTPLFNDSDSVPSDYISTYVDFIQRRAGGEPVSHILGYKWFWNHCFYVNSDVLDPRPDTEIMIEQCLDLLPADFSGRILDLGTGSGCIMATLLHLFPNATGVSVDISGDALQVADVNMKHVGVSERVQLLQSSWFDNVTGTFDLIISNPPYIPDGDRGDMLVDVLSYDPHGALFADDNGLADYKHILFNVCDYMNDNASLLLEFGQGQAESVSTIGGENSLKMERIVADYAGIDRCIVFSK